MNFVGAQRAVPLKIENTKETAHPGSLFSHSKELLS
jgi:hypothetical protein